MNFNRNNFKNIIIASIFLVVLIGPNFALAVTVEELQVQIKALMEEIKRLQEQLSRLQAQPSKWCHNFNVNLRYGDTGNEVYALHIALEKEGFIIPDSEKKDIAYFGDHTASAVVGFQEKYKEEVLTPWGLKRGTGYVGPTTRNKLNKLYGCKVTPLPPKPLPTVWKEYRNEEYRYKVNCPLDWSINEYSKESVSFTPPVKDPKAERIVITVYPNQNELEFNKWINQEINNGRFRNKKEITIGIKNYKAVEVVDLGIVNFRNILLNRNSNTYSIYTFEDNPEMATFNHMLSIFEFLPIVSPSITILSPNGGEKWIFGAPQTIRWTTKGISGGKFGLYLMNVKSLMCHLANVDALAGEYTVTLQENQSCTNPYFPNLVAGKYKIHLDAAPATGIENSGDISDDYFTIVKTAQPSCVDSDGGKDYYVKGTIIRSDGYTGTDRCIDPRYNQGFNLIEEFCVGNLSSTEVYRCPYGCQDGACKKLEALSVFPEKVLSGENIILILNTSPDKGNIVNFYKDNILQAQAGCNVSGTKITCTVPTFLTPSNYEISFQDFSGYKTNKIPLIIVSKITTPSITILSPNGGEKLQEGSNYLIRWNASNLPADAEIGIVLLRTDGANVGLVSNLPSTQREYLWKVTTRGDWGIGYEYKPSLFAKILGIKEVKAAGVAYKIMVSATWGIWETSYYGNVWDKSDNYFDIVPTQPSITVLSPNGGEKWTFGTPQTIKWTTEGVGRGKFILSLINIDHKMCYIGSVDALPGTYTLTLQENQACHNPYFPNLVAGKYKIHLDAAPVTGIENSGDESDDYFNIIPPSLGILESVK